MTRWQELDAYLDAHGVPHGPPRPSQTTSGTHAAGSYHYNPPATARDYGDADGPLERIWQTFAPLAQGEHAPLVELFGPWGLWKNGQRIYNTLLQKQHNDHVHAAIHPDRSLPTQQPEDDMPLTDDDYRTLASFVAARISPAAEVAQWYERNKVASTPDGIKYWADRLYKAAFGTPVDGRKETPLGVYGAFVDAAKG